MPSNGQQWPTCAARVALVDRKLAPKPGDGRALIRVPNADLALVGVLTLFAPAPARPPVGVYPSAIVDPTAILGRDVAIGPGVYIGAHTRIGDGTILHPHATIYDDCTSGAACELHSDASSRACQLGARVILHPTPSSAPMASPSSRAQWAGPAQKPQIGHVIIGDDVEIGPAPASIALPRAAMVVAEPRSTTSARSGTTAGSEGRWLSLPRSASPAAPSWATGLTMGGKTGIRDHLTIGAGAQIAAYAAVMHPVPPVPAGPVIRPATGAIQSARFPLSASCPTCSRPSVRPCSVAAKSPSPVPAGPLPPANPSPPTPVCESRCHQPPPCSRASPNPPASAARPVFWPARQRHIQARPRRSWCGVYPHRPERRHDPSQDRKRREASPASTLHVGDATVDTCEHVLSAVNGLGIDNLDIELSGPELPDLDGSAKPFVDALLGAGLESFHRRPPGLSISTPIMVRQDDSTLAAMPSPKPGLEILYELDYSSQPAIGPSLPSSTWAATTTPGRSPWCGCSCSTGSRGAPARGLGRT